MIQLSTNLSDPLMDLIHTNAIQEEDCHLLQWILERSHAQVVTLEDFRNRELVRVQFKR